MAINTQNAETQEFPLIGKFLSHLNETAASVDDAVENCLHGPRRMSADAATDVCVATRALWMALLGFAAAERSAVNGDVLRHVHAKLARALDVVCKVNPEAEAFGLSENAKRDMLELVIDSIKARIESVGVLKKGGTLAEFERVGIHDPTQKQLAAARQWETVS